MSDIAETVTRTVDGAVDQGINALPAEYQGTAREAVNTAREGLSGAWDGAVHIKEELASKIETALPALGETGSNIAAVAAMGVGGLLAFNLGKGLTGMFSNAVAGEGMLSSLASNVGGLALAVGAGALALNYLNGTGPFAPKQEVAAGPATPGLENG